MYYTKSNTVCIGIFFLFQFRFSLYLYIFIIVFFFNSQYIYCPSIFYTSVCLAVQNSIPECFIDSYIVDFFSNSVLPNIHIRFWQFLKPNTGYYLISRRGELKPLLTLRSLQIPNTNLPKSSLSLSLSCDCNFMMSALRLSVFLCVVNFSVFLSVICAVGTSTIMMMC